MEWNKNRRKWRNLQTSEWRSSLSGQSGSKRNHKPWVLHKALQHFLPIQRQERNSNPTNTKVILVMRQTHWNAAIIHEPKTGPRPASSIPKRQGFSFQEGEADPVTISVCAIPLRSCFRLFPFVRHSRVESTQVSTAAAKTGRSQHA